MRTKLRGKVTLLFMMLGLLLAIPAVALASDVDVTSVVDVTTPTGEVTLAPGGSETVTINMSVTGNQVGTATFEVNQNWELQADGTFVGSNPKEFTVGPRAGGAPANIFTTTGKVSVANGVAAGGPHSLTVGVFDITNTNSTGAKLSAGKSATYKVTVTSPPPPSNTAPQVSVTGVENDASYEIGSVPDPGCSVVDAEDTNESADPDVGAIQGTLAAYGLGSQTVTCTYTDGGGITRSASVTYAIVDTGNPTITDLGLTDPTKVSGTAGSNGWYTSQVTNTFRASDTGAGFDTTGTPPLLQYNFTKTSTAGVEGSAVKIASGAVSDVAGNTAASIDSQAFKIDLNNPSLGTIVDNNAVSSNYCTGSAPSKPTGFNPSDTANGSGIDSATAKTFEKWTTPLNNVFGIYSYEAKATDIAGRTATYGPKSYNFTYGVGQAGGANYSGALQPINSDGSSRFKTGSTVPVKFTLTCGSTPITDAAPKLTVKQGDTKPDPGLDEAISTSAATTGNAFRLVDATTGTYMFNLSTKSGYLNPGETQPTAFSQGTWTLGINFGDTTSQTIKIQLVR